MKTITNETTVKIFAMYLGQNFVAVNDSDDEDTDYKKGDLFKLTLVNYGNICIQANSDQENWNLGLEKEYVFFCDWFEKKDFKLQLKELSNITDDDAIDFFNLLWSEKHSDKGLRFRIEMGKSWASAYLRNTDVFAPFNFILGFQYLQSKGYAMPYINYTVEDLVELGIYNLKK